MARNTQEDDDELVLVDLSIAVATLLNYIRKQPTKHFREIDALSSKVREEIKKEKEHVRKLAEDNRVLPKIYLRWQWHQTLNSYLITENNRHKEDIKRLAKDYDLQCSQKRGVLERLASQTETIQFLQRKVKYLETAKNVISQSDKNEQDVKQLKDLLSSKTIEMIEMSEKNRSLEIIVKEKDHILATLNGVIDALNDKKKTLETVLQSRCREVKGLEEQLVRQKHIVKGKEKQLTELNDQLKQSHEENMRHDEIFCLLNNAMCPAKELRNANERRGSTSIQGKDKLSVRLHEHLQALQDRDVEQKKTIASLISKLKPLESEVQRQKQTISDLEILSVNTKVELNKRNTNYDRIEKELKEKNDHVSTLSDKLDRTLQHLQISETEISSLKTKNETFQTNIEHSDLKLQKLEKEIDKLRTESYENEQLVKVDESDKQLLEYEGLMQQCKNQLQAKEVDFDGIVTSLKEKNQSLEEEVNENNRKVNSLQKELENKNTELEDTRKRKDNQIAELRDQLHQSLNALHDKEVEMKQQLWRLESEISERNRTHLEETISSATGEMSEKNELQKQTLKEKDCQLCDYSEQLTKTLQTLQGREKEMAETITALKSRNLSLEKNIESHRKNVHNLQKTLDSFSIEKTTENERFKMKVKQKDQQLSEQSEQIQKVSKQMQKQSTDFGETVISLKKQNQEKDCHISELKKQLQYNEGQMKNLEAKLKEMDTSLKKKFKYIEDEVDRREQQIIHMEEMLKGKLYEFTQMRNRNKFLENELNEKDGLLQQQRDKQVLTLKQMHEIEDNSKKIITSLQKNVKHQQREIESSHQKLKYLENMLHTRTTENTKAKKETEEKITELKNQLHHVLTKLKDTETELDETKTRLSKAMGDRLTDNNPNITDLSDRNRPTKLAERCAELYDNQWTDAFDILEKYFRTEESVIGALLYILQDVIIFCNTKAHEQMEELGHALEFSDKHDRRDGTAADVRKALKDCRKTVASTAVNNLYQMYVSHLSGSSDETLRKAALEAKPYAKECLEICWFMMIQDPPVVFAPLVEKGSSFNTDLYKPYTSSGTHVDFVVWPPLLLHEGGPILAKGVAQGYGKKSKKET